MLLKHGNNYNFFLFVLVSFFYLPKLFAINTLAIDASESITGNMSIGGTLDVTGSLGSGWHYIKGEKTVASIGTSATPVLTITFANLAGSTNPLFKGVRVHVYVVISGSVTLIITPANSVNYFYGDLIVSPGATSGTACALTSVTSTSTNAVGNAVTFTASVTGNGTTATLNLAVSSAVTTPSVAIFYEVMGDNLSSVS